MEEEAVSLALAAERLGVTRQRAQQLLRDGVLTGPAQPQGQRAVRNAPRVSFTHWRPRSNAEHSDHESGSPGPRRALLSMRI